VILKEETPDNFSPFFSLPCEDLASRWPSVRRLSSGTKYAETLILDFGIPEM
jgi:hypothetical protein